MKVIVSLGLIIIIGLLIRMNMEQRPCENEHSMDHMDHRLENLTYRSHQITWPYSAVDNRTYHWYFKK